MIEKSGTPSGEATTIIGADAAFKGELTFEKGVRVDGRLEGKIVSKGQLTISQGGKLQAEVQALGIVVEGEVVGNLHASDRIELRKTAQLRGDLRATKLLVAEGASFVGQCHVGPDASSPAAPMQAPAPLNRMVERDALPRK
ncbi:MAG: bactofilin family protein [Planctomycetaceae bacterium]